MFVLDWREDVGRSPVRIARPPAAGASGGAKNNIYIYAYIYIYIYKRKWYSM